MSVMFSALLMSVVAVADEKPKLVDRPVIIEMHKIAHEKRNQCKKCKRLPLQLDENCCKMAQDWAEHLARTGKFHHGKNDQIISRGYKDTKAAFGVWMRSSGHRAWLLTKKAKKCGWGYAKSKAGTPYWVGVFR